MECSRSAFLSQRTRNTGSRRWFQFRNADPSAPGFAVLDEPDPDGVAIKQLFTAVEAHAHRKAQSLERYQQLAERSEDPVTTLVVRLIVGNEENQRRLLDQLSLTLRDQFKWTESPDDLPNGAPPIGPIDPDLIEISRGLIREEQVSADQLRALADRERGLNGGLDSLLLEAVAMSNDIHAQMLRFIQRRLERRNVRTVERSSQPPTW